MVDDGGVGAWGATACREPPAPTRVGPPRAAGTSTSRAEVDSFLEANQVMREPGQADRAARARLGRKPRPEEAAALRRQSWANGRCNSKQEVRTDGRAWQAEGQRRLCASGAATSWALCCCRWGRQPWPDGSVGPGGSIQWEGKGGRELQVGTRLSVSCLTRRPATYARCRPGLAAAPTCASCRKRSGPDRTDHRPRAGRRGRGGPPATWSNRTATGVDRTCRTNLG